MRRYGFESLSNAARPGETAVLFRIGGTASFSSKSAAGRRISLRNCALEAAWSLQ
jgi:hypothetical protein